MSELPKGDEDNCCPKTGRIHRPKWDSIHVTSDGGQHYVDVNCADCGISGCVTAVNEDSVEAAKEVSW